ncbi:hypothetical protein F4781DRAFT_388415 [Annulohypoxylon bovei var. microspora]|nr:hypothetical protein F4781DRAFT_388415 [Annulohypoxylon bovei var. microspora]
MMSPQIDIPNFPSTTPSGPTSPHHEKDAVRAMSRTNSWQPSLARRQSYHQEDQKHALQMSGVQDIKECPGFTERK